MTEEQSEPEYGNVVFTRNEENSDENMWDDTALIKAYDKAVKQAHNANEDLRSSKPKKKNKKSKAAAQAKSKAVESGAKQWSLGDSCRARYSEDGIVYPAMVTDILNENECVVQYTEYGNEEHQNLTDLMPPGSRRSSIRGQRQSGSRASSVTSECSSSQSQRNPGRAFLPSSAPQHPFMPSFVPPPPPKLPEMPSGDMDEALHSMLISWYMSGYHTGYYQGLKDAT